MLAEVLDINCLTFKGQVSAWTLVPYFEEKHQVVRLSFPLLRGSELVLCTKPAMKLLS